MYCITTERTRSLLMKLTAVFYVRKHRENLWNTGKTQGKHREFYLGRNVAILFNNLIQIEIWRAVPNTFHQTSIYSSRMHTAHFSGHLGGVLGDVHHPVHTHTGIYTHHPSACWNTDPLPVDRMTYIQV